MDEQIKELKCKNCNFYLGSVRKGWSPGPRGPEAWCNPTGNEIRPCNPDEKASFFPCFKEKTK